MSSYVLGEGIKVAGHTMDLSQLNPLIPGEFWMDQKVVCVKNPNDNQALSLGGTYTVTAVNAQGYPKIKGVWRKTAKFVPVEDITNLAATMEHQYTPLVKEADPELEKLLQEEEEIEAEAAAAACPFSNPNGIKLGEPVQFNGHSTDTMKFVGVVKEWPEGQYDNVKVYRTEEAINVTHAPWFSAGIHDLSPYHGSPVEVQDNTALTTDMMKAKMKYAKKAKKAKAHFDYGYKPKAKAVSKMIPGCWVKVLTVGTFSDLVVGQSYKVEEVIHGHPVIDELKRDVSTFEVVDPPELDEDHQLAVLAQKVEGKGQEEGAIPTNHVEIGYTQVGFNGVSYMKKFIKHCIDDGYYFRAVMKDGTVHEKVYKVEAQSQVVIVNPVTPANPHHNANIPLPYGAIAALYIP